MKDVFRLALPAFSVAGPARSNWLAAMRRYLAITLVLDLAWETAQLPLYTIWAQGTAGSMAFAVLHCTAGDVLIALSVLVGALIVTGHPTWPEQSAMRVAALTLLGGLGYTVFSEWLNVEVRQSWGYSDLMPILPPFGTGLSPLLQWVVIPIVALWTAHRAGLSSAVVASEGRRISR